MSYNVYELAAAGYHYYEVEGGSWWSEEDAMDTALRLWDFCEKQGYTLAQAAEEVGGTLLMEE